MYDINSSLSFTFELVGTMSLDRNDQESMKSCLGYIQIYLKLRKCCNLGQKIGTSFQRKRLIFSEELECIVNVMRRERFQSCFRFFLSR